MRADGLLSKIRAQRGQVKWEFLSQPKCPVGVVQDFISSEGVEQDGHVAMILHEPWESAIDRAGIATSLVTADDVRSDRSYVELTRYEKDKYVNFLSYMLIEESELTWLTEQLAMGPDLICSKIIPLKQSTFIHSYSFHLGTVLGE